MLKRISEAIISVLCLVVSAGSIAVLSAGATAGEPCNSDNTGWQWGVQNCGCLASDPAPDFKSCNNCCWGILTKDEPANYECCFSMCISRPYPCQPTFNWLCVFFGIGC